MIQSSAGIRHCNVIFASAKWRDTAMTNSNAAALYLDLWEKNLALIAARGLPKPAK